MGDQELRLLYLVVLGAMIIAGIAAMYRGRLGAAAQNAAIWGLIFLGAIVAYGLKDRIALFLTPGTAIVEGEEIVIARRLDGHFAARLEVNGVSVNFLVDTGASDVVLGPEDARRIGFDIAELAFTQTAVTANGLVRGAPVVLDRVQLAGRTDRKVRAVVNAAPLPASLLGMSYLDRFARVSFEGDLLRLTP
ncbi:MAG: TIGR02281 family clan AA aspartic protease [Pikeienuella sp.]